MSMNGNLAKIAEQAEQVEAANEHERIASEREADALRDKLAKETTRKIMALIKDHTA